MKKVSLILSLFGTVLFATAQNVGIGTTTPAAAAQLDVSSTSKGLLMPRMTTAQRDAIAGPVVGLQIFNLDDHCTDLYDGTNWIKTCGLKVVGTATDPGHPTPNSWTQKANFGGTARQSAVSFSIGSKGYIGTGVDASQVSKNDFWQYDNVNNTWTQKANFGGSIRANAVGFSIGSKGYVGTGQDNSNGFVYKDFWEYSPETNTWTKKADFGGTARFYAVGFSIGSKGYVGTGYDENNILKNDFWEYNPANNTWTQKANVGGQARLLAVGFSIFGKGYIGTGADVNNVYLNDFWEYNPDNNTWTQKANFGGLARYAAVGFSIGVKGYIGSGIDINNNLPNDFWEYNPSANAWLQKANFGGLARYYATGFSIGSKGYIGTGYSFSDKNDFWEYMDNNQVLTYSSGNAISLSNSVTDGIWTLANGKLYTVNDGNVGIGTTNPQAPLHIGGLGITTPSLFRSYFSVGSSIVIGTGVTSNVLIRADGWLWANGGGFVATSDARIKNIIGLSNNATDLAVLNTIEITDYKYKDEISHGSGLQKKVIAQQLQAVYPVAVTTNKGIIPNLFETAASVTSLGKQTNIATGKPHGLVTGDQVKLILEKGGEKIVVIAVVDANTFSVNEVITDRVFVYGKQVNDLLNVDYDAVSMLNVSATQELSKQVKALQKENTLLKANAEKQKAGYEARLKAIEDKLNALPASVLTTKN